MNLTVPLMEMNLDDEFKSERRRNIPVTSNKTFSVRMSQNGGSVLECMEDIISCWTSYGPYSMEGSVKDLETSSENKERISY
ncbi:hypothetical protein Tco_1553742 [Tanacetum coccineum]